MKSENLRIFIVEDDPTYIKLIKYIFELNPAFEIYQFNTGKECIDNLHLNPNIISLDYSLPDMTGSYILEKIKAYNENINVIVLSGQSDISTALELLKNGAYDYIVKNGEASDRLRQCVFHLQNTISLTKKVEVLNDALALKYDFQNRVIGTSPAMQNIFKLIGKAIKTNITVSITGETGSGKEIIARSIHYNSRFRKGDFVAVNVSAIPGELLESELFGYEKGAFTGANARKLGYFEVANEGTLFLDEIAEMDFNLQSKLLRVIQERELIRLGGTSPTKFDARLIVATHKDLAEEVNAGRFREDLYYRLLGLPIKVPPLRRRGNDVLLLMRYFLNEFASSNQLGKISIEPQAKEKLLKYSYPGNVRELKAIVELAVVLCENNTITEDEIRFNSPRQLETFLSDTMTLKEYNRKIIDYYLKQNENDVLLVAKKLNIGKSTIYRMLKEDAVNN